MLEQAARITKTAHLFQAYVDKCFEVRVTVIGEAIFAAAIYSQHSDYAKIDFRKRYADLRYATHQLPDTISAKILKLMKHFGLVYGALDLIVTSEGDYQFLEINASGQFGWIEAATDLPLFHTLACLLAKE
jgi:glutathione synthase/RimK-type ligase-like ATP-grasp enzyme